MLMLIHMEQSFTKSGKKVDDAPICWTLEGRAFVIRNREDLVKTWLPLFFRHGKFQSFTRKLYRWGFRQVNLPREESQEKRDLVFASPHFQREQRKLMVHMKSVTAASLRREQKEQENKTEATKVTSNLQGSVMTQGLPGISTANLTHSSFAVPGTSHHHQTLTQNNVMGLSHFSGMGALGERALLDPLVRQSLLNRERMERGPSLLDLYNQVQLVEQLRGSSSFSLNLGPSDRHQQPLGSIGQYPVNTGFLESLIASTAATGASLGNFGQSDVLHRRLLEVVQQLVRNSSDNNGAGTTTSAPPPAARDK
jgi:hypothetical protein